MRMQDDYLNIDDGEDVTPGPEYNIPSQFGQKSQVAGMRNSPSFGMLPRSDKKAKVVISHLHKVDNLG